MHTGSCGSSKEALRLGIKEKWEFVRQKRGLVSRGPGEWREKVVDGFFSMIGSRHRPTHTYTHSDF